MVPSSTAKGGASAPPYLYKHSGPVLVCGSAWCLADDFERARSLFPHAGVIAVNGAAEHVPADHLYSQHPLKMPRWRTAQYRRFGLKPPTHGAGSSHLKTKLGWRPPLDEVDYWWGGVASKGSSGWGARRLAAALGYSLVILCGMPMDPGPYQGGMVSKLNQHQDVMDHYRQHIMGDTAMHDGVWSMSGWTRDLLGAPDESTPPA